MSHYAIDRAEEFTAEDTGKYKLTFKTADTLLTRAAQFWFLSTLIGLWIFVFYIVAFYIGPALQVSFEALVNPIGKQLYLAGDTLGNLTIVAHFFVSVAVFGLGPLQLIPQIRTRFPAFHRWNGRLYIPAVFLTSIGGLYLIWIRGGGDGNVIQHIGTSIDAVLILIFAFFTLRHAIAGNIANHRRWALRLFMVVNAVWFLRIGYRLWVFLFNGFTSYFDTFFTILHFGQYLVPLAILELFFLTQKRAGTKGRFVMAMGLFVVTIFMGIAIFAATTQMWLPRL